MTDLHASDATSTPLATITTPVSRCLENWPAWSPDERWAEFAALARTAAEELFLDLDPDYQAEILERIPPQDRRSWVRLLPLDDTVDLVQAFPEEGRESLLELLDPFTRAEVRGLLTYAEDRAGGIMTPQCALLRPEMTVDEAVSYLRAQAKGQAETIYYAYVVDQERRLLGVLSFRDLFAAPGKSLVREVMRKDIISIPEQMDQEEVGNLFSKHDLMAIPVVDDERRLKGIITVDDVVNVVQQEATEDIQKIGGSDALGGAYLELPFVTMLKKRAGWLVLLFVSEAFTATAMGYFEHEIARAVVLALFIPLIISSGGNSGSQASTLIIRALALGEVRIRDWWRVFLREMSMGVALGSILGTLGLLRIVVWPTRETVYGEHFMLLGLTVAASVLGVVLWGTLTGSMLPFLLRAAGFDPAVASAPFVATLVDVTGIVIYFATASAILSGTLL
jgi:magnesium transporter